MLKELTPLSKGRLKEDEGCCNPLQCFQCEQSFELMVNPSGLAALKYL